MLRAFAAACLAFSVTAAPADPVAQCLSCHIRPETGALDITGLRAMQALPEEWPFLFEDAFDLNGDGIAGKMRFVSGADGPIIAIFGQKLAAGRFEDFATLAGRAHDVDISQTGAMERIKRTFETLSPPPITPFQSTQEQTAFEARGCAACHTTQTFEFEGQTVMPLSDFLLHETHDGPRRTAPLWGCRSCIFEASHDWLELQNEK